LDAYSTDPDAVHVDVYPTDLHVSHYAGLRSRDHDAFCAFSRGDDGDVRDAKAACVGRADRCSLRVNSDLAVEETRIGDRDVLPARLHAFIGRLLGLDQNSPLEASGGDVGERKPTGVPDVEALAV